MPRLRQKSRTATSSSRFAVQPTGLEGELRAIAQRWFEVMRDCGDDVRELLHDGHPTACVADAAFSYVNAFKSHVNVGFFQGAALDDPLGLLKGSGGAADAAQFQIDNTGRLTAVRDRNGLGVTLAYGPDGRLATAKDPARRYPTAPEMAADLRRFIEDRPILARRITTAEFGAKALRPPVSILRSEKGAPELLKELAQKREELRTLRFAGAGAMAGAQSAETCDDRRPLR